MKKIPVLILMILSFGPISNAQLAPHKYLIKFTDKNNSPYSISDPFQFLSAKAIARRTKQGIGIKDNDLPVSPAYIDSIASTGVTLFCRSRWFNSVTIYTTDSVALHKIRAYPFVLSLDSITKNKKNIPKNFIPEKPIPFPISLSNTQSNRSDFNNNPNERNYGTSYNQIDMIKGDYLHDIGCRGQGMTIAVIDAGFYYADTISAFDSLWQNNQILGTKDFVTPGGNVFREYYHGMMVLSVMGANLPGQIVGTAPKASYWLLRSEDVSSEYIIEEYNWASAAEFADSVGADLISTSLGYTTFDSSFLSHTYADMNGHTCPASIAAGIAASKGMIVCASAGNSAQNAWHYIGTPADADSIITVGGVDASGNYAAFSSTGPTSDGRIKPTVAAQAQATVLVSTSGHVMTGNGTSFSSPIIAGATACLWQAFPKCSNMQIIDAIIKSSSQYSNPDSLLGYGIPNFIAADILLLGKANHLNSVNIFPNPFNSVINIVLFSTDAYPVDIDIIDIAGKEIFSEKGLTKNIGYTYFVINEATNLKKGFYILRFTSNGNSFSEKIIKIE